MTERFRESIPVLATGVAVLAGLFLARFYHYLLFHSIVEIFSVLVAFGVFTIAWNARRFMVNNYFLFIGIAFFFIGATDLLHTLAYKGMGVFPDRDANLPTQLWVVARYLHGFTFLVAPFFLARRLNSRLTFGACLAVTAILLVSVFSGNFPDCFVDGEGLTPFKKWSEYLICLLFAAALVLTRRQSAAFNPDVLYLLSAAIVIQIASELSFTLYNDVYGIANMAGHVLKLAGFWLVHRAIIVIGLTKPYDLLFRELNQSREEIVLLNDDLAARARELHGANRELEAILNELAFTNRQLAASNQELEAVNQELETTNQELETTNRDLETANQELEAFNYTVSHDLRSPLTCVKGFSQLLLDMGGERLTDQDVSMVEGIHSAAERMDQLVTTLLRFSHATRKDIIRETVDLAELARECSAEQLAQGVERKVAVLISGKAEVCADPQLLRVMMQNLMGNALKYSSTREDAVIEFGVLNQDGEAVYFVRDNGVGFDMTSAEKLFAVFSRLHASEEFEGTGIGLATVQRIVQRHGGKIWAEGEPGRGATFYFTLDEVRVTN